MQNTTQEILIELQNLRQQVVEYQRQALLEVLSLEEIFNKLQSTSMIKPRQETIHKKQPEKIQKPSLQDPKFKNNIEQMFADLADFDILNINKNKKQINNNPPPIIEKKPPIPTMNRINDPNKNKITTTKFVPPRNKNEVTGKVTQNKIITQQKTFKPQIAKSTSKKQEVSKSIQKRTSISVKSLQNNTNKQIDSNKDSIAQYKEVRCKQKKAELKRFNKTEQELIQSINSNKSKKKQSLKPLIEKFNTQQMGHRDLQKKKREAFMKGFANLYANKKIDENCDVSIKKRCWKQYPHIFNFNDLLQDFSQKLDKLLEYQRNDLRTDQKQVYRLHYMKNLLQKQLKLIKSSTEIQIPQKIKITFKPKQRAPEEKTINNQTTSPLDKSYFFQKLTELLNQINEKDDLQNTQLQQLKALTQISIYKGKKSPLVIQSDQYQEWKQFYDDV